MNAKPERPEKTSGKAKKEKNLSGLDCRHYRRQVFILFIPLRGHEKFVLISKSRYEFDSLSIWIILVCLALDIPACC